MRIPFYNHLMRTKNKIDPKYILNILFFTAGNGGIIEGIS